MIEIIPAIIPQSFDEIREKTDLVRGAVRTVQIDIMDGVFVPEKSWPYRNDDSGMFEKLVSGEIGLPYWNEIDFEIDLMVRNPKLALGKWLEAGASRIIVHFESTEHLEEILLHYGTHNAATKDGEGDEPFDSALKTYELGLALNIDTPNERVYQLIPRFDFIQCMGISQIGYQGEPLDEAIIPKIKDLRKRHPGAIISIDGGVNFENAPLLVAAGTNRLVSGSTIWNAPHKERAIQRLMTGRE